MSGIFSGGGSQAASALALSGIQVQTSVSGRCIAVLYGTTRASGNLLDYDDFTASPQKTGGKGGAGLIGGGGGKGGSTQYTYSATVVIGMCEGPIFGFGQAWASKSPTDLSKLGITTFLGTYPQAPWSHIVSKHPANARPYTGIAYVAAAPYDLGNSGALPNNNLEVYGFFSRRTVYETAAIAGSPYQLRPGRRTWANNSTANLWVADLNSVVDSDGNRFARISGSPAAGQYVVSSFGVYSFNVADSGKAMTIAFTADGQDADASLIVNDILTNAHYGMGYPANRVGEISAAIETHIIPASPSGIAARRQAIPSVTEPSASVLVRGNRIAAPSAQPGHGAIVIVPPPPFPVLVSNVKTAHANSGAASNRGQRWTAGDDAASPVVIPLNRAAVQTGPGFAAQMWATNPGPAVLTPGVRAGREPGTSGLVSLVVDLPGTFQDNLCVADADTGDLFTCVAAGVSPAPLQYSFVGGTYTFNPADSGKTVEISYVSLGGLATYQNYLYAAGIFVSPQYVDQATGASILDDLAHYTNSEVVSSAGALRMVPRGDTALAANGHSYTPPVATVADLTDEDFQDLGSDTDPLIVLRKPKADQVNVYQLQFTDRASSYDPGNVETTDQAMIDAYGRRVSSPQNATMIADAAIARLIAQLLLQREAIRANFTFTLNSKFAYLDPMDIVSIADPGLQIATVWIRIIDMMENTDGTWAVTAEEYLAGTGHALAYVAATGSGFAADYNEDPGSVNAPVITEPPVQLATNSGLEVWVGFSGADGAFGGAEVWVASEDQFGAIQDYQQFARRDGQTRQGALTGTLAIGTDPDTTNQILVDISTTSNNPALNPGSTNDADQGHTLCLIDSELVAYSDAVLIGSSQYSLSDYLRRGMYGTAIASHAPGAPFARIDETLVAWPYDRSQIGQTIHFKFRAYNTYGGALQDLSQCIDYPHTIVGPPAPATVQNFSAEQVGLSVVLEWTDLDDVSVKGYDILYGVQGDVLANATLLTTASRTTETTTAKVGAGLWTFYIFARNIADQFGPVSQVNVTLNAFQQTFDLSGLWTKPAGITATSMAHVEVWAGGGGGAGNGNGGGGGAYNDLWIPVSQLGATEIVTVGAGGGGGAVNHAGGPGGITSFGLWVQSFGGGGGFSNGSNDSGGGGGGITSGGNTFAGANGGNGGGPLGGNGGINSTGPAAQSGYSGGGGADQGATAPAGSGIVGGGGGGGGPSSVGGSSVWGGGGGAGINAVGTGGQSVNGGDGGDNGQAGFVPSGGGGGATGANGGAGASGRIRITILP